MSCGECRHYPPHLSQCKEQFRKADGAAPERSVASYKNFFTFSDQSDLDLAMSL
jgi:hypothetical protein